METTIHDVAKRYLAIYQESVPARGKPRREYLADLARRAIKTAGEESTEPLFRDYRGWDRKSGERHGPGSGRSYYWLDLSFEYHKVICDQVRKDTGLRDDVLRKAARSLHRLHGGEGYDAAPSVNAELDALPCLHFKLEYWDNGYREAFTRSMCVSVKASYHATEWRLYFAWHIEKSLGKYRLFKLINRLKADPNATISGYLAASILLWQGNPEQHDYRSCSDCGYMSIAKDNPELWDFLISRAPVGVSTPTCEQVFPHEIDRDAAYERFDIHPGRAVPDRGQ